ncbi:hypothetical protein [Kineobactrum salinum]|uniref:Uncharacterized protein n=1 Tax=Kineobactrum salinum TaxID=2708301 RepID=A0A6C0U1I0_9GAMM|nr:hypothetical protein [Kineobactrum salinum]QIB64185.1 hypothetical protein G3T16_00930 [Kineobactrum salinum]
MVKSTKIYVPGPLKEYAAGFAYELRGQGYTTNSASLQMNLMTHLSL